jgi:hypothetical protein
MDLHSSERKEMIDNKHKNYIDKWYKERRSCGGEGGSRGSGGEMTQTMYAHMNKWILKKEEEKDPDKRTQEWRQLPF